jgi:hypothetical protein
MPVAAVVIASTLLHLEGYDAASRVSEHRTATDVLRKWEEDACAT